MRIEISHIDLIHEKWKRFRHSKRRGFALMVVLLLMVLLTVVALGLLSLSSISLRTAGSIAAQSEARANARLALMLALGELQKTAGTDKAATATSEILSDKPGKPNLTGVWQSWDYDAAAGTAPDYTKEKKDRFQGWLVSDPDPDAVRNPNYPTAQYSGDTIELVGEGTLGKSAPDEQKARAGRVTLTKNGKVSGAYAWHVADESVKARIATYRDPSIDETLAKRRALLSGMRPDVSVIRAPDGTKLDFLPGDDTKTAFKTSTTDAAKLMTLGQVNIPAQVPQVAGKFRNAITPYSMGLLTNARKGGLKKDLTSMFETASLPNEFLNGKLYQSTKTLTTALAADPNWSALQGYYKSPKFITKPETLPTYSAPPVDLVDVAATPPAIPVNYYAAPVISKVEILFGLVVRGAHGPWTAPLAALNMPYMLHVLYIPVITLHNPYNVALEVSKVQVVIQGTPVAFNFFVNGQPQNGGLVSLSYLYSEPSARNEKSFALDIGKWASPNDDSKTVPSNKMTLLPGQSLICGPYIDPASTFGSTGTGAFFDYTNSKTGTFNAASKTWTGALAKPGFYGKSAGFDIDWLTPTGLPGGLSVAGTDGGLGVLGLKTTDMVHCEFGMLPPAAGALRTKIQISGTITAAGAAKQFAGVSFDFGDEPTLAKYFPKKLRYPSGTGAVSATEMYETNSTPVSSQKNVKIIGVLSAYARTTNGGVYENGQRTGSSTGLNTLLNGRIAGKPFLFQNPAAALELNNLKTESQGDHSHELNLQPLPGSLDDYFDIDSQNRARAVTGNTVDRGIKSASYLELPTGPMQSIADFRRSGALSTPFKPGFSQPVASSWVSPMMTTSSINTPISGSSNPLLDQPYLANHSLYDNFFFSTVAPDGVTTGADKVFKEFQSGARPLLNQGFQAVVPKGETSTSLASRFFSGAVPSADAYKEIAAALQVKGPFNINSTSVEAWKAVLSSMSRSQVSILWAKTGLLESHKSENALIMATTLPNGGLATAEGDVAKIDDDETNEWNGYRELSPTQITTLAEEIVDQVRERGPFLSMSEFVNRRIGPESDLTRAGALQIAIKRSKINDGMFLKKQKELKIEDFNNASLYSYKTPEVLVGNPAEGAPGWISQGDLMRILEPAATSRGDTFVIRVCGQAVDGDGKITARAYAEAVVQRVLDFVDPADSSFANIYLGSGSQSAMNRTFGRRFEIVSFRWLSPSEI